jgi:hypothetical protein
LDPQGLGFANSILIPERTLKVHTASIEIRDFCPLCFLFKKAPGKLRSLLFKNPDLLGHSAIRQAVLESDYSYLAR